uniref:Uncharacterized protein n=1 Tax=Candidatus Methanophaga sp. ANME-1 ERB7 TaxID=2759913 RepID=A0A7G9Z985_9EURY|nr:hypothetical protein IPLBMFHP_00005 [Methanosarcinales archaeon ANME-1 ERB7]
MLNDDKNTFGCGFHNLDGALILIFRNKRELQSIWANLFLIKWIEEH